MIYGIFHKGSGLGNQLHRFVGTKVLALEKGEEHSMIAPELFKGRDFINLDFKPNNIQYTIEEPAGKVVPESYDGVYDGEFQGEEDFIRHIDKVREWLKVEPLDMPDDLCVISHRGGEYKWVKDLYLPIEYWELAIEKMKGVNPNMCFRVVTDDVPEAKRLFPNIEVSHEMSNDWRSIRYAHYLIVSNSSFSILPSLLNTNVKLIIAPQYHAGYLKGYWQSPQNCYNRYTYIHHND